LTHLADLVADSRSGPSDKVMRNESRETVSASLMQLSPVSREVLILRHIELLSVSETAEILGIPEGTVKSRHLRSLKKLRLLLAAYEEGE
jgi:RNA polymerase sigma-70 factor (ECF subfamily)